LPGTFIWVAASRDRAGREIPFIHVALMRLMTTGDVSGAMGCCTPMERRPVLVGRRSLRLPTDPICICFGVNNNWPGASSRHTGGAQAVFLHGFGQVSA